jgi:hypothetical protein
MGERIVAYGVLVGRPEGRRPFGRPTGGDGKIILKWIVKKLVGATDCIGLFQDRYTWRALVNAVLNLRVSQNAVNFSSI